MTHTTLEYTRIIVDIIVAIIFLIGVIYPLKNTIIPYWKKFGRPSTALLVRFGTRIFLLFLVIHNAAFPLYAHFTGEHSPEIFRALAIPLYASLGLLYLYMWFHHPDGPGGL